MNAHQLLLAFVLALGAHRGEATAADGPSRAGLTRSEFLRDWDRRYRLPAAGRGRGERNYARAASELKSAIVGGIADEEMYYRLGYCYEKIGDYGRALDAYGRASEGLRQASAAVDISTTRAEMGLAAKDPLSSLVAFHRGVIYARRGDYKGAAREFEGVLRSDPRNAAAHNNLGYCYRSLFMKRRAVKEFEKALELDSSLEEAWLNKGVTEAELGRLGDAENSLRKAIGEKAEEPAARYCLALVLEAAGKRTEAAEQLRASASSSDSAKVHLALAGLYLEDGRTEEARREAERAFDLHPELRPESPRLAAILEKGGEKSSAIMEATDEESLLNRAAQLESSGKIEEAEDLYRAVLGKNPRSAPAYAALGRLSEQREREGGDEGFLIEKSISLYRRALDLRPDDGAICFRLGVVYERAGMYGKAADAFARLEEIAPGNKLAAYHQGVCYSEMGETDAAEGHFLRAMEIDPRFEEAYFQLGALYSERRDFAKAINAYETAVELNPADADAHFNLGQIYRLHVEDRGKALRHLRAYLELAPGSSDSPAVRRWCDDLMRKD